MVIINNLWMHLRKWSVPLGRILGVRTRAHVLGILGIALWFWHSAYGMFFVINSISFLAIAVVLFVHELSHALTARCFGNEVKGIVLAPPFVAMTVMVMHPVKHARNILIYLSGPLTNIAFSLAFMNWSRHTHHIYYYGSQSYFELFSNYFAVTGLYLGIINLVPLFPLDGGRVLRELMLLCKVGERKADMVTLFISFVCFSGLMIMAAASSEYVDILILTLLMGLAFFILLGNGTGEEECVSAKEVLPES